jgi:hypothetical protein
MMSFNGWLSQGTVAFLVLWTATGCSGPTYPHDADPRLRTTVSVASDWQGVERPGWGGAPGFSFSLPPGFLRLNLQPIDSDAAVYERARGSLHYDYGAYTGPPSAEGRDAVRQRLRIGGRTAVVVSYVRPDGTWVTAAWWRALGKAQFGEIHLYMQVESTNPADRPELLAALYSVEFE